MKAVIPLVLISICNVSIAANSSFAAHWRADDPCAANGYGMHNSMTLEKAGSNGYAGSWEESTNSGGWAGQIKGQEKGGKLTLSRCIDPESSSWSVDPQESCPHFKEIGSYKLHGNKLVRLSKSSEWPTAGVFTKSASPKEKHQHKLFTCSSE